MLTLRQSVALVLCLLHVPHFTFAFLKKTGSKRQFPGPDDEKPRSLFFKGHGFEPTTIGATHGSVVLECAAGGSPNPTIHWLKNGERIIQGYHNIRDEAANFEDHHPTLLRLATTKSRLYIDCLGEEDEAEYTCVAETETLRKTQSTYLKVEKPDSIMYSEIIECNSKVASRGEPARVIMWTVSRLEYETTKVQLFCRAAGTPEPQITWYDQDRNIIQDNDRFRIAKNGDLIIHNINWITDMGYYTCEATNEFGTDSATPFLYPTPKEESAF